MRNALITSVLLLCSLSAIPAQSRTEPFILGADISWVDQREASGTKYADNGTVKDIFLILNDHKFNWIRLRIFVDPTARVPNCSESPYSTKGYCDLAHTRAMAKRIKAAGMKFLLDFHYSDVWADPGKQFKPVSWEGLSFDELKAKVRSYTKETLEAFKADGALPDMVQVGNEIVGGMIWPDGKSSNMSKFADLVNAGIDGVKDVSPDIRILIHSISENSPSGWLKSLVNAGVKRIDVFGLSYYSEWHGTPADLKKRVEEVAKNHSIKIAIAEYADNHRAVNDIIYNLPEEKGLGTFFWEPQEWKEALFDYSGGKRVTNSRIDLYPTLSKEYGNDDFVATIASRLHYFTEETPFRAVWLDNYSNVQIGGGQSADIPFTLLTLQGRIVGGISGHSGANLARSAYLITIPNPESKQNARLLPKYR